MVASASHILVVEDDRNSATMLVDLLTSCGYAVTCEATGPAAVERIRNDPPDLVLLDLRLPGQNGFMVAEAIRRNPATAQIPIIVVSAFTDRQNRLRAFQSGVNLVMSKPVDTDELPLAIANLLSVTHGQAH